MLLPLTSELLPSVEWLADTASTNQFMRDRVERGDPLPHGALIATADQTAGRGRQGRGWVTPPDTAVAASLLIRGYGAARAGGAPKGLAASWLPLLAGSAIAASLQPLFGASIDDFGDPVGPKRVGVKWPNDVHVRDEADAMAGRPGLKLCGILCEMLPDGSVIVGTGINLLLDEWDLPTDRATSLLAAGAEVGGAQTLADEAGRALADRVLAGYTAEMLRLVELASSDPEAAKRRVLRDSLTVGSPVRVHLPNGDVVDGLATGLDEHGALIVERPLKGRMVVNAADVEHLRAPD